LSTGGNGGGKEKVDGQCSCPIESCGRLVIGADVSVSSLKSEREGSLVGLMGDVSL
jgi:hypothetical protein